MKPRETWLTRMPAAMSLRKAAWVSKLDMQVDMPGQAYSLAAGRADLKQLPVWLWLMRREITPGVG